MSFRFDKCSYCFEWNPSENKYDEIDCHEIPEYWTEDFLGGPYSFRNSLCKKHFEKFQSQPSNRTRIKLYSKNEVMMEIALK